MTATLRASSDGTQAVIQVNGVDALVTTSTQVSVPTTAVNSPQTNNSLSLNLSGRNNFSCTPSSGGSLTFTNLSAGQSGFIKFVNSANYTISAASGTKLTTSDLSKLSGTGTYIISYYCDGTDVFCAVGGAY